MLIRPATPADAPALSEIQVAAWRDAYRTILPEPFLGGFAVRHDRWEEKVSAGVSVLASVDHGRVVGYCSYSAGEEEGWAELRAIYVHPRFQGRGHGSALMQAAEKAIADDGFIAAVLWVFQSNEAARRFYERRGWELAKPIRIETIGGIQITLVRYEIFPRESGGRDPDRPDR